MSVEVSEPGRSASMEVSGTGQPAQPDVSPDEREAEPDVSPAEQAAAVVHIDLKGDITMIESIVRDDFGDIIGFDGASGTCQHVVMSYDLKKLESRVSQMRWQEEGLAGQRTEAGIETWLRSWVTDPHARMLLIAGTRVEANDYGVTSAAYALEVMRFADDLRTIIARSERNRMSTFVFDPTIEHEDKPWAAPVGWREPIEGIADIAKTAHALSVEMRRRCAEVWERVHGSGLMPSGWTCLIGAGEKTGEGSLRCYVLKDATT